MLKGSFGIGMHIDVYICLKTPALQLLSLSLPSLILHKFPLLVRVVFLIIEFPDW